MKYINLIIAVTLLSGVLLAEDSGNGKDDAEVRLRNMAEELVELRSKVESLSTKVEMEKSEMQQELKSLVMQKRDLKAQIKRVDVKLSEIENKIQDNRKDIRAKEQQREKLQKVVKEQVRKVASYVRGSLPFKRSKRDEEVSAFREKLKEGSMLPEKVLARVWSMVEDEFRLTGDSGLYSQNIELDGKTCLTKVVRLGMVLLYFRTIDGKRVGYAVPAGEGRWEYRIVKGDEEGGRIRYLFDCLEKHIQEGYFELPNPYRL